MRVLLVEDHIEVATSTVMLLELLGHVVKHAATGHEALDLARDFKPDIMLVDIGLPDMNGFDLGREFRKMDVLKDTVMVALTGFDCEERAKLAGFSHYCKKPMDVEKIDKFMPQKTAN
jgi:CheY-like chemotaxis protein